MLSNEKSREGLLVCVLLNDLPSIELVGSELTQLSFIL